MNRSLEKRLLDYTNAHAIESVDHVQTLWSGFGAIERIHLTGGRLESLILKRIQPPSELDHPRGWNSDVSAERKLRSYQIERRWYEHFVPHHPNDIRLPEFYFSVELDGVLFIAMEDLHCSGYNTGFDVSSSKCLFRSIEWLAEFHAYYLGNLANGLWENGTYWQLETRKEEYHNMPSGPLKENALRIHNTLNSGNFQTIIHGDAKPANFCFSKDFDRVAAVDFQYVGRGCGIKDLIYLMSGALDNEQLYQLEGQCLDAYFRSLFLALEKLQFQSGECTKLEKEWRGMYIYAWADFVRFLKGWSPDNSRLNEYALEQTMRCLNSIE